MPKANSNGNDSGPTTCQPTVHLILQGKGGVGKSVIASWLAEFLIKRGQPVCCIDGDPVNRSLGQYKAFPVEKLELVNASGILQRSSYDALVDRFIEEETVFVVDRGATAFLRFWTYIVEADIVSVLRDAGRRVYIHIPISGGEMLTDTLLAFKTIAETANDRNLVATSPVDCEDPAQYDFTSRARGAPREPGQEDELAKRREHERKQQEIDTAPYFSKNPLISRGDDFIACDQDPERCRDGVRIGPPNYWDEHGTPSTQASLIMDLPNGRIPPLTAEAQKMAAARTAVRKARPCSSTAAGCHDSWEDESLWDRCISRGLVGSVVPSTYNQGNQVIQAPGYVVFRNEMIHEARIIPLGNRPHLNSGIRSWMGDSRGHWEGNTLVVETTNFRSGIPIGNIPTSDALRTTERFTLTDVDTLRYQLTIDDPKIWTRPWTIAFPLKRDSNYTIFEYACHEGNYYMYNALAGARADEKGKNK